MDAHVAATSQYRLASEKKIATIGRNNEGLTTMLTSHSSIKDKLRKQFGSVQFTTPAERPTIRDQHVNQLTQIFDTFRREIIRPRMDEFCQCFSDHGISTKITINDRRYDALGRLAGSIGITLRVYLHSTPTDAIADVPHYAIYWEPMNSAVRFYRNLNAAGRAGDICFDGRAAVHDLNVELIDEKLLRFAELVLS